MSENDKSTEAMIQAAGLNAPRLSPDSIKAAIASEHYFTASDGVVGVLAIRDAVGKKPGDDVSVAIALDIPDQLELLTFCVLVLKNGFTVTGKSACVSPENFDANIGRKVARDDAISQVWPLEGYLLKQRLFEAGNTPPAPYSALPPHQQRVMVERDELESKISKLAAFFATPTYTALTEDEQFLLSKQHNAMADYALILRRRIEAFPAA